ncbi:hypothetical protein O1L44_25150 [Streptomyces noursei]|nr:hypothetical protein [Streptomyces noursei]
MGRRRAAAVFAAGHVGASLLVYAGLRGRRWARRAAARPAPEAAGGAGTAHAVDVGASYGFYATLGALAASVPHRGARAAATGGCWRWARCRWSAAAGRSPTSGI